MSRSTRQHLRVEIITGITIVGVVNTDLLAEDVIQEVSDQLFQLLDEHGADKLLVNFRDVRFMSSAMVAQLVKLHRKIAKINGKLKLCGFNPTIREVFRISNLDRLLDIYEDEQLALDRF